MIRGAVRADCDALLLLIRQHADFERAQATIDRGMLGSLIAEAEPEVRLYVAEGKRTLHGFAAMTIDFSLWRGHHWGHLDCLFVSSEARGLGVGAALLEHVRSAAASLGLDRLEWQTPRWNQRAIEFYRREGAESEEKMRFGLSLR